MAISFLKPLRGLLLMLAKINTTKSILVLQKGSE